MLFIVFPNFWLICCYFVLVTIIIFDFVLENGWFEGRILYFNTQICEYHILFNDGTTDYVAAEYFDGIDFIYCKSSFELVPSVRSPLTCVSSFN